MNFLINLAIIISMTWFWSCSNSIGLLSEGKGTGAKDGFLGSSQDNNSEFSNQTPVYEEEDEEESEEDIQAEVPTVLSGAHLSFLCSSSTDNLNSGQKSISCQLGNDSNTVPYQESKVYLLSETTEEILELPVIQYIEENSWNIEFSINSYMNHSRWILALEITELEGNHSAIFVEELELVLAGNRELTWFNPASASIDSKDYITIIEDFKVDNTRNKDSLISTQIPMDSEAQRQLTQPVIEGSQVFQNTKLAEGNLRVIVVYDSDGLPVHEAELELMNHQIAEYAVNEDLPIRIEPLNTQVFLNTDTSNAALIIWNDMGAGGANFSSELVQKFKLSYNSGIPFLAFGADLTTYHLNMDSEDSFETSEDWSKLIHLGLSPDQGNPFDNRKILVTPDAETHAAAIGPYGIISDFTYNLALDHPSQVKEGGIVFAVDQFGNSQAVISDLSFDTAPTFTLNCLLHLINEQEVSERLFKNVISNILRPLKEAVN